MKLGSFKLGQAKLATESFQVSDHSTWTAYSSVETGPQTIAVGQLVETDTEHWVNGYELGQQADGRKWRTAVEQDVTSSASVRIIETPLALYGTCVAEIPVGNWIYQERSWEIIPHYRTLVLSCYARKMSASNGTLSLQYAIDEDSITVTDATTTTVTDSSKAWETNALADYRILFRTGRGKYQHRTISSNTGDTVTLSERLGTIPAIGDEADIISWTSPTVNRLDTATGAKVASATVIAYSDWQRFYGVFRPGSFNRLYVRIRSAAGTLWVDGAKLEKSYEIDAGMSTGSSATTVTDSARGWVPDEHLSRRVIVLDGDDVGDSQVITDNDQTSITATFAATPSSTSTYIIVPGDADVRPSPYIDLQQVSASFAEISAYDIYGGTLLLGGGLAEHPRLVIEDGDGLPLLRAGDNLDSDGFRGWDFLNGACARFTNGKIIMRSDQGGEDAGCRITQSYQGIEGWLDDDLRKWGLYTAGAGFEFTLGTSPLQARIEINDDSGIAAFNLEGRKWWGVRPQVDTEDINYFWLGFEESNWLSFTEADGLKITGGAIIDGTLTVNAINTESINLGTLAGTLDSITDGSTYGKVLSTNITAGQIILSACDGDLDDIADGSTYGKLKQTIISGGFIQVGTGTKDDDLDGWAIDNTEIVGQEDGEDQVRLGTDGSIYWAGGDAYLDATGAVMLPGASEDLDPQSLRWVNTGDGDHVGGRVQTWVGSGAYYSELRSWGSAANEDAVTACRATSDSGDSAYVQLQAIDGSYTLCTLASTYDASGPWLKVRAPSSGLHSVDAYPLVTINCSSAQVPTANGAGSLVMATGSTTPTLAANTSAVYVKDVSASGEVFALDEAGNSAQLTPHDPLNGEWYFYSHNVNTGRHQRCDLERLVKFIDRQFGTEFYREWTESLTDSLS